ncbi:MAG TPA: glycerophosphodiester phosphodiesterase family protein [Pyrinomonadaceae bacterium]|jgi:glycerophosphoryl diester phosphodiesterase|nr:glycerophosphodiester phosphodiesterase family protein [Pyrinomonadaceae bacterium]
MKPADKAETTRAGADAPETRRDVDSVHTSESQHVDATPPPLVVGHRGASAHAPENTLAAFRRALDDGADGLEFDVRLSHDRVPVVIHDATLKRTALRGGLVRLYTASELGQTDVGSWFNRSYPQLAREEYAREFVPTLAEVFETTGERARVLYVELKCDAGEPYEALAADVARLVRAHSLTGRVVVESFELCAVRAVKNFAPEIRTAALFERTLARPAPAARALIKQARDCGADEIALHHSLARARTVAAAHAAGLGVVVWTVDDSTWARRAREAGVRALITNHPARMRAAVDALDV